MESLCLVHILFFLLWTEVSIYLFSNLYLFSSRACDHGKLGGSLGEPCYQGEFARRDGREPWGTLIPFRGDMRCEGTLGKPWEPSGTLIPFRGDMRCEMGGNLGGSLVAFGNPDTIARRDGRSLGEPWQVGT